MTFKRTLRSGMSGSDVLYIKRKLFAAGYYAPHIRSVKKQLFGGDTLNAVRAFQRVNVDGNGRPLVVDGVIGRKTWGAILLVSAGERDAEIPGNIGHAAAAAITGPLLRASAPRRAIILNALAFAYDPTVPAEFPHSLYLWGGNLYNTDLTENTVTTVRIDAGAKRTPQYYSEGRKAMMKAAVRANPAITGADCSGGIVGLLRKHGLVKPTFDATADMLASGRYSATIRQSALEPGDFVGYKGHIGLYAGGGYVVEWMGGAFGCQLSRLDDRRGYDFVAGKLKKRAAWSRFRRPAFYE